MRTYIILLAVSVLLWSCQDQKLATPTPQPVTEPEPTVLIDTLDTDYPATLFINAYRWAYYTGQQEDSVAYGLKYLADTTLADTIDSYDMGMPVYDGISLVRREEIGDVFYEWPYGVTPIPNGKVWNIPAVSSARAANVKDPLPFPAMVEFPDTFYRSTSSNVIKINTISNGFMLAANFDEAHHSNWDYSWVSAPNGVYTVTMTIPANYDSVYITVLAQDNIIRYNSVNFIKRASWSKWVYLAN